MAENLGSNVAIIGAGMAGLICAGKLKAAGHRVTVFDKSRGVGGRLSTRRGEDEMAFDHGAQYFTVKDAAMQPQVEAWIAEGVVAPWDVRIGSLEQGLFQPVSKDTVRYVGTPAMNALGKHLADGLNVQRQTRVTNIRRSDNIWRLEAEGEPVDGAFDVLLLNAPGPQTAELTAAFPDFCTKVQQAEIAPCWAAMVAFKEPLPLPYNAAFVEGSPLSWIARNSSKPQRSTKYDCWVLHGSPEWSQQHLEQTREEVLPALLDAFWQATGLDAAPHAAASAHRWRYALPVEPLDEHCLFDGELQLGACGDWCGGPRVEGAYLSGLALAEKVLG